MAKTCWILLLAMALSSGCNDSTNASVGETNGVAFSISGTLRNATSDTVRVWDFYGNNLREVAFATLTRNGTDAAFNIKGMAPAEGIYLLGTDYQHLFEVVLGPDREFQVVADMNQRPARPTFTGSATNQDYAAFLMKQYEFQAESTPLHNQMMLARGTPQEAAVRRSIDSVALAHYQFNQAVARKPGILGKVGAILSHKPWNAANPGGQPNEGAHIRATFFGNLNFADPQLGYIPAFFSKIQQYVTTLVQGFDMPASAISPSLDEMLAKMPANTKAHQMAMLSVALASAQLAQGGTNAGKEMAVKYIDIYSRAYPQDPYASQLMAFGQQVQADLARSTSTRVGNPAPDLQGQNPTGQSCKLSQMRGKYVLIDFWASWCRPCRAENPNVVRLYDKYKSRGFEVFSVSLDNDAARWKQAIEADGLTWTAHISDLKGWQSAHAASYGVSAIPFTVLLDREGKILATNLRGPALETKLAELLGN